MASPSNVFPAACDIPLPGGYQTAASPSIIVFTLTIGFYFINGLWAKPDSAGNSWIAIAMFLAFAGLQTWIIRTQAVVFNKCRPILWKGIALAWVVGIVAGTISYWVAVWFNKTTGGPMSFTNYSKEKFTMNDVAFNNIAYPGLEMGQKNTLGSNGSGPTGVTGQCLQFDKPD